MTLSLYREEVGAATLWFEAHTVTVDAQERSSELLAALRADDLPMDLFASGEARRLSMSVGKLPEQARDLLVSFP